MPPMTAAAKIPLPWLALIADSADTSSDDQATDGRQHPRNPKNAPCDTLDANAGRTRRFCIAPNRVERPTETMVA